MLTTTKTLYTGAISQAGFLLIALRIIVAGLSTLPAHAQSKTADSFNFDEISVGGKGSWNFTSEDETVSIRDNLKKLREYDISGAENFDIRMIRRNRRRLGIQRWGNRGDRPYYSVGDGFYPYYFRESRIFNYY